MDALRSEESAEVIVVIENEPGVVHGRRIRMASAMMKDRTMEAGATG